MKPSLHESFVAESKRIKKVRIFATFFSQAGITSNATWRLTERGMEAVKHRTYYRSAGRQASQELIYISVYDETVAPIRKR